MFRRRIRLNISYLIGVYTLDYITPDIDRLKESRQGNFSQPMKRVSIASMPSVRCSSMSSSDSISKAHLRPWH